MHWWLMPYQPAGASCLAHASQLLVCSTFLRQLPAFVSKAGSLRLVGLVMHP